ncbi:MAG: hypothetical protein ACREE0_09470 [Phenylobacterium sp.]
MIRIITLAATAALLALPASAQSTEKSIRISTAGKSVEQVRLEVFKAAKRLCANETISSTFPAEEMRACMKNTMRTTLAQSSDPALKLASR